MFSRWKHTSSKKTTKNFRVNLANLGEVARTAEKLLSAWNNQGSFFPGEEAAGIQEIREYCQANLNHPDPIFNTQWIEDLVKDFGGPDQIWGDRTRTKNLNWRYYYLKNCFDTPQGKLLTDLSAKIKGKGFSSEIINQFLQMFYMEVPDLSLSQLNDLAKKIDQAFFDSATNQDLVDQLLKTVLISKLDSRILEANARAEAERAREEAAKAKIEEERAEKEIFKARADAAEKRIQELQRQIAEAKGQRSALQELGNSASPLLLSGTPVLSTPEKATVPAKSAPDPQSPGLK